MNIKKMILIAIPLLLLYITKMIKSIPYIDFNKVDSCNNVQTNNENEIEINNQQIRQVINS